MTDPQHPPPDSDLAAAEAVVKRGMELQKAGALDEADALYRGLVDSPDPVISSLGWRHVAGVYRLHSAWADAIAAARHAASIAQQAGLREPYAEALNAEAIVYQLQGDFDRAVPLLEEMLGVTADAKGQGIALQNLGSIAAQRGDFETARRRFMESHACFQRAGYTHGVAFVLNNFGRAALDHANPRLAQSMLQDALGAARRVGDRDLEALVTRNLAEAALALGEVEAAGTLLDAAQRSFAAEGNRLRETECVRLRGELAERRGDIPAAIAHYQNAIAAAAHLGAIPEIERAAARLQVLLEESPEE